jgi:hypothetical protein
LYFTETSLDADESRHFPTINSGFLPIIPSQVDPRPAINIHTEPRHNPISAEQNFFPSFFRAEHHHHQLSTSRPFSLRHASTSSLRHTSPSTRTTFDPSILGSGDFTVMRGGTFYPEGEDRNEYYASGSSYFDTNTGRPFALPLEQPKHHSDDPFANFKDFADITAGIDSDFSHYIVVYAKKNSTKHEPRNILEQLEMLDRQKEAEVSTSELPIKITKKMSKIKMKLRSTKLEKKYVKKKDVKKSQNVDYVDPLVADS